MSLGEAITHGRIRHPQKPALRFEAQCWSYTELDEITDEIGAGLRRRGVRPGDRVALLFTNCPEMVFGYYACFKIGAVAVPLNFRLQGPELEYILDHCGARFLLGEEALFAPVQAVRASLPQLEQCFLTGESAAFPEVQPFAALREPVASTADFPDVAPDAIAAILYTSGTTAHPKGVTHTHATFARQAADMIACGEMRADDVMAIATPLCHASGFQCHLLPAMQLGATVLVIPRPDPPAVLRAMARHRATCFLALPVLCNNLILAAEAASYDLSALRVVMAGGDAVTPELQRRFQAAFGVEIAELWGMTEIVPGATNPITGTRKVGSIGIPAPSVRLRLVDDAGRDVGPGEVGEILVRSEAVMIGYWDNPEATAATLQDGWLRTGDLARSDADGYYWFVGRKKEIIIRGGSNISPLEVEEVLYQHPAVREAGVIGVPDPIWGEVVMANVARRSGAQTSPEELKRFLQERIAAYKVPEAICFLPELPKGSTGKVHRKTLREWTASKAATG